MTSSGQIHLAGETLELKSYDVSVKGIMVEVVPGKLLSRIEDFEALLVDNNKAEIFVKELSLTGEAAIVWVKEDDARILLGLEYRDVKYNAQKLWLKRLSYRKKQPFSGTIILKQVHIDVQGINISLDGMTVMGNLKNTGLDVGQVVKLKIHGLAINKALAKIIWINENNGDSVTMGLHYLEMK